jgi:signal peptidase complex subunit 2
MPRTPTRTPASPPPRSSVSPSSVDKPKSPLQIVVSTEDRDEVKVNNASLGELKNACDDALKRYLSRPELFNQNYMHTDIRLGLGWASVFVALGTALYGYKIEFEQSKPVVWAGLIAYIVLSTLQTLYAYFVEGDVVFVGKRKTFSKRIVSERITLSSKIQPCSSNPSKSTIVSTTNSTQPRPSLSQPAYSLTVSYVRSTSGGKSLLAKGKTTAVEEFGRFFDERGVMDQEAFERWVGGLVEEGMEGKVA